MTQRPDPAAPRIAALKDEFVALRRHLHQAPELAYEEHETSALVAGLLRDWGYAVETGIGVTGVVGTLTAGSGTRSIGIRADMDGLPIHEATNLPYASRVEGRMHACGHDGHTASLLLAARYLAESRNFSGTLRVIFQPAEENGGGARKMISEGLFERFPVDAVFGLHNWPGVPAGQFAFLAGPAMASVDMVIIRVQGKGGHGAKPHLAIDPIVVSAAIVMALQTIVSRNTDPLAMAVVTVGSIHGGSVPNVIPDSVELQLTVRSFDPAVQQAIKTQIATIAESQAKSFGAHAEVVAPRGYPTLVNDPEATTYARNVAERHFGTARLYPDLKPITASEDFAFMLEQRPGSYLFLGNGDSAELHSPHYDFNDAILPDAALYWVRLAEDYLGADGPVLSGVSR